MKNTLQIFLLCFLVTIFSHKESKAQTKLIHYWDFNRTLPTTGGGGTNLNPIAPDYSTIGNASLHWDKVTPSDSIVDNGSGGAFVNERPSVMGNDSANGNLYVRTRNPSVDMYFEWYLPTNGYKNIVLKYASERSGSGPLVQNFDYSIDGGTTFITAGLPIDSFSVQTTWTLVSIDFSSITSVNDNSQFVFRMKYSGNTSQLNGNDRFDNVTLEGDTMLGAGINEISAYSLGYNVYPNPASNNIYINSLAGGMKNISIANMMGQTVYTSQQEGKQIPINISQLNSGCYFINVSDRNGENRGVLKFVKNN